MSHLPKLRPDLEVFEHSDDGGHSVVVLRDPVSQKFFRLSQYEYRFLEELDGRQTPEMARQRLREKFYYYSSDDVSQILRRASQNGLILGTSYGTAQYQRAMKQRLKEARKIRRLSSVYFLFIPIINPDRFLDKTLWLFNLLWNRFVAAFILVSSVGAIYLIVAGIPKIKGEYLYFFNLRNLFYLWITIALTKLIHEFAHAYTAKRFGLSVPEMGLAFLIFFPCLYCNTTDAWRLANRRERMAISGAGVLSEAAVAVFATYVWHFTKPGVINSLSFYLMGVSLISTLFFNGNPLLKFDGYFVLSDYLNKPNLYSKSFNQLRYIFWNRILGVSSVEPSAGEFKDRVLFTTYGVGSFMYRIFLYVGIIGGVYYRFDKTIGIVLAALALALFVARPILGGLNSLFKQRKQMRPRLRGLLTAIAVTALLMVPLTYPLPNNSVYPCYLDSASRQKMTVPLHTWISEVKVRQGEEVKKGQVLYSLDSRELDLKLSKEMGAKVIAEKELEMMLLDDNRRAEAPSKILELLQIKAEERKIKEELIEAKNGFVAPFDGIVTTMDPRMQNGFQPGAGEIVGELESNTNCEIHGLIPEEDLHKIRLGENARVQFSGGPMNLYDCVIHEIKPFSEENLRESPFSSRFGGDLATEVTGRDQKDSPLEAYYDCVMYFSNKHANIPLGMTGRLIISSRPVSITGMALKKLRRTFNRESLL